jgi:hypothetical protein
MSEGKAEKTDLSKLRRRKKIRKTIYFALLIFALLYIPVVLLASGGARADIAVIGNGVISDFETADGIVIREEEYISLPFDGVFAKDAMEGERVPAGYRIATVVDEAYSVKFEELEKMERDILDRKRDNGGGSGIFTRDLQQIEEKIAGCVSEIAASAVKGDLRGFEEALSKIEEYSSRRDAIISGNSPEDTYTRDLVEQYEVLKKGISDKMHEIYTKEPGYISYQIDGLEKVLTPANITGYTVEELQKAVKNPEDSAESDPKAVARLIKGNSYILAFVLDDKKAEKLESLNSVKIEIAEYGITVTSKDTEFGGTSDGKTCVFFKINEKLSELAPARKIGAKIIFYEHKGLMVPLNSLVNIDAYPIRQVELAKVSDNWVHFIEVEIAAKNETYAIIESPGNELALYDSYVTRPYKVSEGQVVR